MLNDCFYIFLHREITHTFPINYPTLTSMQSPAVNSLQCDNELKVTKPIEHGSSRLNESLCRFNLNLDVIYFEENGFFKKLLDTSKKKSDVESDETASPLVLNISGSHVFKVFFREIFTSQLPSKHVSDPSSNKAVMRLLLALRTKGGWATVSRLLGKRLNMRVIISDEDIVYMTNTANEIFNELGFEPLTMGSAEEVDEDEVLRLLFSDVRDAPLLSLERPGPQSQTWMSGAHNAFSSPGKSARLVDDSVVKSPWNGSGQLKLIDDVYGTDINKEMIFFNTQHRRPRISIVNAVIPRTEVGVGELLISEGHTPPSEDENNDNTLQPTLGLMSQESLEHSDNASQSSVDINEISSQSPPNSQAECDVKHHTKTVTLQNSQNNSSLDVKESFKLFFGNAESPMASLSPTGIPPPLFPFPPIVPVYMLNFSSSSDSGQGSNAGSQSQPQYSARAYSESLSRSSSQRSSTEPLVEPMEEGGPRPQHQDGHSLSAELPNPTSRSPSPCQSDLSVSSHGSDYELVHGVEPVGETGHQPQHQDGDSLSSERPSPTSHSPSPCQSVSSHGELVHGAVSNLCAGLDNSAVTTSYTLPLTSAVSAQTNTPTSEGADESGESVLPGISGTLTHLETQCVQTAGEPDKTMAVFRN